jgi:pimeloyl-ACP methyl ester carboxylesterase
LGSEFRPLNGGIVGACCPDAQTYANDWFWRGRTFKHLLPNGVIWVASGRLCLKKVTVADRKRIVPTIVSLTNRVSRDSVRNRRFSAGFAARRDDGWGRHNPTGKYVTRSPIFFADRVRSPTLNICGALDRNTPAGQALEFHSALRMVGVESVLVTYPHEGHGVRNMPAVFDYTARLLDWFCRHMPAVRH